MGILTRCCFACIAICGCKDILTRSVAFYPPKSPTYSVHYTEETPSFYLVTKGKEDHLPPELPWLQISFLFLTTSQRNRIPVLHVQHTSSNFTVIFSHGNSTDLGGIYNYILDFATFLGVSVLVYDYSGYGYATGKPSEKNIFADIRAVYDYALKELGIPWNKVVLYGHSIGTACSCDLASEMPVGGIVLQSPMASGYRIIASRLQKSPWFDIFRNIDKAPNIRAPVFLIHGTDDTDIPIEHSESLLKNFYMPCEPWWVQGANHENIETEFRRELYERVKKFLGVLEGLYNLFPIESLLKELAPCEMSTTKTKDNSDIIIKEIHEQTQ